MGDNWGIYLQSKYSQAPSKQVIPTFLDLTRGARKERALQNIFQNIINNTDIIDILAGNSITVIPGSYSGTLSQAQITSGWKNSSPNKVGEYYRDIELISAQELKEKFEQMEVIMINTILDIIRLLNDGNIVPMQKDEDTKIDLYNEKVQLFMDASGEESKYYYFSELEIDDENQDNLAGIEDVALNNDAYTVIEKAVTKRFLHDIVLEGEVYRGTNVPRYHKT